MTIQLWLRAETKPFERRTPLTPEDARILASAGHRITVERSALRCFDDDAYGQAGCALASPGSWRTAPASAFVLGLKALSAGRERLVHRHIFFGHVYKGQPGAAALRRRFLAGGGALLDLECLTDDEGRRLATFGHWAGFAGAAVALKAWCGQKNRLSPPVPPLSAYESPEALQDEVARELGQVTADRQPPPRVLVIGALGRSGRGACALLEGAGLSPLRWDMAETAAGDITPTILAQDLLVSCVLAGPQCPVFVPAGAVENPARALSVICDVSCDPQSPHNPLPVYDRITSFEHPVRRLAREPALLDLIAIDHLPSLLPRSASIAYSAALSPLLAMLERDEQGIWRRARAAFDLWTGAGV